MRRNVGKTDGIIRTFLGIIFLAVGYINGSWLGLLGAPLILTAAAGWCPVYFPLGISTRRINYLKITSITSVRTNSLTEV